MKKWIGSLVLAGMTSAVMAQAPFTIVKPADGARVRETVHVLIPKGSIPEHGYIGIFLGGKFLEATLPPLKGKYYDYALNTKKLGLADTEPGKPLKLELVLYTEVGDQSRIQNRTSVDINIGNQANIPIPNSGVKLAYAFRTGQKMIYRLDQQISISTIDNVSNGLGGRAAEFTQDGESIRLQYEVMNAYPNGDGLLRIQPMPEKGKDYALLTADNDQSQKKWMDFDMAPIYMRIRSNGKEVFGSLPEFFPFEGSVAGGGIINNLFADYPLPTLPSTPKNVGDAWQSQFQEGALNLSDPFGVTSLVEEFPARGEFVSTEWEMGHPCAKIKHVIEAGTSTTSGKKLKAQGSAFADDKISLQETIWFALDTHEVLKVVRDETIDRKLDNSQIGFGGGGNAGSAGVPGGGGPGIGGPAGMAPAGGGGPAGGKSDRVGAVGKMQKGRGGVNPPNFGGPQGGPPRGGPGGFQGGAPAGVPGGGNFGQGSRFGAPSGGGSGATATYIRIRSMRTFTLESH